MKTVTELKVRPYELDMYRHVNNAVYLNYLEVARADFMEKAGIDFRALTEAGYGLVVVEVNIKYRQPALLDDILTIETQPVSRKRLRGVIHQVIRRGERVLTEADVSWACVDFASGRPVPFPKGFAGEALGADYSGT